MTKTSQSNIKGFPLVAPLARFGRADLDLAGGKGANLGELSRAGFDVPPGFVITTAAYDLLLQENGLDSRIDELLADLDEVGSASIASASQRIREMLQNAAMPAQVAAEVLPAFRRLGGGAVAVRSSATAEDLPGAAFAGQQETFLNVQGEEALLEAVRACWASLWSERAVHYRLRHQIDQSAVRLAVVVQQMVPAGFAGVLFTANPLSGARDELVIDANPGLGEAVVSGLVTPDHFVVDRRSQRLKEQRPGRREVVVRLKAGGGTEQVAPVREEAEGTALPSPVVRKLAHLGIGIERHFGAPQDIEWAWARDSTEKGRVFILQARPMTALPEPVKAGGPMQLILPMLAEMWPARPYPLDVATFTGAVEAAIGNLLVVMMGKSAPSPGSSFVEEDGVVVRFQPPEVHPSPGMLLSPWVALWRARFYDPARWKDDPLLDEVIAQARQLEERRPADLTWAQNIDTLHEALALIPRTMELRERYLPRALLGLGGLWLLLALARSLDRFGGLVSGVETKTTETNRALDRLAAHIRNDPTLGDLFAQNDAGELSSVLAQSQVGQTFLESFEAFLARYGHRETSLTISQPAWRDQPETVLGLLKVLGRREPQEVESYQAWKSSRDDLLAHSILGARLLRRPFLKSLASARALFQIREDTHFYVTLLQPLQRRIALELGRRLEEVGALPAQEDVFHLRLDELEPLGDPWPPVRETIDGLRGLVARRKARRSALAAQPLFDPRLLAAEPAGLAGEDVLLRGSPGSPGRAGGPARIIRDSSEFGKLQPGDVLVAPVTNPAWTPLFQQAAAVVVDTGGVASHAAITAREYGLPAVMGTLDGTQKLKDGQWVRVDGSRGLVLKGPDSPSLQKTS
jgi:phosphohistidine swiveling domain-containing protein